MSSVSSVASKLFPEAKILTDQDSLFHYHKGRVCNIKFEKHRGGACFVPTGLTAHDKASGIVKGTSESFCKVDKASKGIKTAHHMHEAANYIARNGDIELEDEHGNVLSKDELDKTIDSWCGAQTVPDDDQVLREYEELNGKKRAADARRFIVSCPKGTDPEKFKEAVTEFAEEVFKKNGYQYVFGFHVKNDKHPNEPDHPHVHFLIKSISRDGRRLNIRKGDLKLMRERFAVIARKYGIELNATNRAVRANDLKGKTSERWHQEKKEKAFRKTEAEKKKSEQAFENIRKRKAAEKESKQSQAQKWAYARAKKKQEFKEHEYSKQRKKEVKEAIRTGSPLKEHVAVMKAKKTRMEVKENLAAYAEELKKNNDMELAQEIERLSKSYKPMKTFQETLLDKVVKNIDSKNKEKQQERENKLEI